MKSKYTKLDAEGNALPDSAESWVMVKDNEADRTWEVKTDDGSIHDMYNTYNWDDAQNEFIAKLNAEKFGGYDDWRLPSIEELFCLADRSKDSPAIDTHYFPNTLSSVYWSSTTYTDNTYDAWCVSFYYGYVFNYNKSSSYYVRAVRGGQGAKP